MPIITAPHAIHKPARKILGPILRVRTVAGGWKMMYVMKNTSVMIDCSHRKTCQHVTPGDFPPKSPPSTHISHLHPQLQLNTHARNRRIGQVRTVHEGDAVHNAHNDHQTSVEAVDDFLLLFRGEVGERVIFEGFLLVVAGVAVFEVGDLVVFGVLMQGGGGVVWGRHDGGLGGGRAEVVVLVREGGRARVDKSGCCKHASNR